MTMTKREALELFNNRPSELAKAVGVTKQAVNNWELDEPIPELRELKIRHEILPKRQQEPSSSPTQSDAAA